TARARLKGISLRDRMVGEMPRYAPWASKFSALVNGVERVPFLAKQIKQALKLAPQRSLPLFNGNFLASAEASPHAAREVLLFVDTFNNYMEGDNAKAAKRVLEAAGYRVHLNVTKGQRPLCCGRTYLSSGQFDKAKAEAKRTLEHLMPFVERGVAVVGLEPSCLLSMRDEFLQYGFGEEAKALSSSAYLFEEFLVNARAADQLPLELKALPYGHAMLHGHCHQKAFDALRPVEQVLGWIPGLEVKTIESSCCGMAGSFGYEAEHYEASLKMAELSLLPAIRNADKDAVLIADGTSCRHQIHDGSGREAIHVARLLEQALA
ncbi:MAG: (Fe-S)-binding protein, partial [Halomonas sp.]